MEIKTAWWLRFKADVERYATLTPAYLPKEQEELWQNQHGWSSVNLYRLAIGPARWDMLLVFAASNGEVRVIVGEDVNESPRVVYGDRLPSRYRTEFNALDLLLELGGRHE